jgi:hypothetical protein
LPAIPIEIEHGVSTVRVVPGVDAIDTDAVRAGSASMSHR